MQNNAQKNSYPCMYIAHKCAKTQYWVLIHHAPSSLQHSLANNKPSAHNTVQYSTHTVQYLHTCIHTVQYNTYSTVQNTYCTVHTVQYIQCSTHSTAHTVQYIQCSTHSTVHTVQYLQIKANQVRIKNQVKCTKNQIKQSTKWFCLTNSRRSRDYSASFGAGSVSLTISVSLLPTSRTATQKSESQVVCCQKASAVPPCGCGSS